MTALLLAPSDVLVAGDGGLPLAGAHQAFLDELERLGCPSGTALADRLEEEAPGTAPASPLHLRGPLPWHPRHGHLFPIPRDVDPVSGGMQRHRLLALAPGEVSTSPGGFTPPCLPATGSFPAPQARLAGWWTGAQLAAYLRGDSALVPEAILSPELWAEEPWMVPGHAALPSRCAGLRLRQGVRLALQAGFTKPSPAAKSAFETLLRQGHLPWGPERRLVRLERKGAVWPAFEKPAPPTGDGPFLVRWTLLTPALFQHGSLPAWCLATPEEHPSPEGQVCLRERRNSPLLQARLVTHHLGSPQPVREPLDGGATRWAVPAGSVYHFLCADSAHAARLTALLHDRQRSDSHSEKGYGHGLCTSPEPASPELRALAARLFHS